MAVISLWNTSDVPATPAAVEDGGVTVGTQFHCDVDAHITAIRFYKGTADLDAITALLWTPDGAEILRAAVPLTSGTGWITHTLDEAYPITAGTGYIVGYHNPTGRHSEGADVLTGQLDSAALHAYATGETPNGLGNGVHVPGSTPQFPTMSGEGTAYYADVLIDTAFIVPTPDIRFARKQLVSIDMGLLQARGFTLEDPGNLPAAVPSRKNSLIGYNGAVYYCDGGQWVQLITNAQGVLNVADLEHAVARSDINTRAVAVQQGRRGWFTTAGPVLAALRPAPVVPPMAGINPSIPLTRLEGPLSAIAPGEVFENLEIVGGIDVYAQGVRFINCWFRGTSTTAPVSVRDGGSAYLEDCLFSDLQAPACIEGSNWTAVRVEATRMIADFVKLGDNCFLLDSYCHDVESRLSLGVHADAVQYQTLGYGLSVVSGCWLDTSLTRGYGSNCVFIAPTLPEPNPELPVGTVLLVGNVLGGGSRPVALGGNPLVSRDPVMVVLDTTLLWGSHEYMPPVTEHLTAAVHDSRWDLPDITTPIPDYGPTAELTQAGATVSLNLDSAGATAAGDMPTVTDLVVKTLSGGATGLDDLSDVDLTGATDGQVLTRASGQWVPATPAAGSGPITLDDLTDVDLTGAADGQALILNGATWEPATITGGGTAVEPRVAKYGFVAAGALPEDCGGYTTALGGGYLSAVRVFLPAGTAISEVGAAITAAGTDAAGYNGVAIYDDAGNRLAQSASDTALFATTGWRFAPCALAPAGSDRWLWLAVLAETLSSAQIAVAHNFGNWTLASALFGPGPVTAQVEGQTAFPATLNFATTNHFGLWAIAAR